MRHAHPADLPTLGADIRALRKSRGITLQAMASRLGRSVGWMSQIERDLSTPSIEDLRAMAAVLEVPLSLLFSTSPTDANEAGRIVRRNDRRPLGDPGAGLVEELLSPDLTDKFEVVHSTFAAGAATGETTRPTQELGYVISGRLSLWIGGVEYDVGPGDSFRIRGEPYRWANPHDVPAVLIWVIAPPVY